MQHGTQRKSCADGQDCIEGAANQGERANFREALMVKEKWRRCGGCVMKARGPYLATPRLVPERATVKAGAGAQQTSLKPVVAPGRLDPAFCGHSTMPNKKPRKQKAPSLIPVDLIDQLLAHVQNKTR